MSTIQTVILVLFLIYNLASLILGSLNNFKYKIPFGRCLYFSLNGTFAWADGIIFGTFWSIVTLYFLYTQNWLLFLIAYAIFWIVRSLGETIYWFNQQFSSLKVNPPQTLFLWRYFPGESIWFVYQIFFQCITTLSGLALIYLLKTFFSS